MINNNVTNTRSEISDAVTNVPTPLQNLGKYNGNRIADFKYLLRQSLPKKKKSTTEDIFKSKCVSANVLPVLDGTESRYDQK